MTGMCERCERLVRTVVHVEDTRGPWALCVACWIDITRDNAEMVARRRERMARGAA